MSKQQYDFNTDPAGNKGGSDQGGGLNFENLGQKLAEALRHVGGSVSGASGSTAPTPQDPFANFDASSLVTTLTPEQKAEAQQRVALNDEYFQLWGVQAPQVVLNDAMKRGLNVYQFAYEQRTDPSYNKTTSFRDQYAQFAEKLIQWFSGQG